MHPMMMMALANEAERDRENERQKLQVRSQVIADPGQDSNDARVASRFARRLAGIGVWPRLS